ncbi:hypothetical protein PR202_ga12780 [Eleusine coracana subsp. coracana]|uniref:Uncharacterized protein n=1 Tax=Eleusine coracana subsp. coracana TaxID=191504 RepID=A0AAV5CD01_ELECO|nr:hypothetical protein PR202_ga12780 [Eleusine coracana subsp. coracana]
MARIKPNEELDGPNNCGDVAQCEGSFIAIMFDDVIIVTLQEKKLVAEIKKTAKTGNEVSLLGFFGRSSIHIFFVLVSDMDLWFSLGGNQNISSAACQAEATNSQFARHTSTDPWSSYPHTGMDTFLFVFWDYCCCYRQDKLDSKVTIFIQAMHAGTSISAGMKGASKAMAAMNKQMEPAKQIKVMREFQKQSTQLDMTLEMMSDAIDETLDKDEAEEETEELTNQVLDEIGVDVASQLSSAPKGRIGANNRRVDNSQARNAAAPAKNVAPPESSAEVDDLERRLASLRRI